MLIVVQQPLGRGRCDDGAGEDERDRLSGSEVILCQAQVARGYREQDRGHGDRGDRRVQLARGDAAVDGRLFIHGGEGAPGGPGAVILLGEWEWGWTPAHFPGLGGSPHDVKRGRAAVRWHATTIACARQSSHQ